LRRSTLIRGRRVRSISMSSHCSRRIPFHIVAVSSIGFLVIPSRMSPAQCALEWKPTSARGPVSAAVTWDPDGAGPRPELLVVGGSFGTGDKSGRNVAAWDGVRWSLLGTGVNGTVNALTVFHGELIAGTSYLNQNDNSAIVVRWNGSNWSPL